ncbi:glutaredoxin domain-containing cysteine-rich protein CG12206-like [Ptychodera flava]|uniref:glutaredoxin domain-containing cysteine-rich protein CG12206-like n=1 Tax=Ptychodera flava TaxID=63121 RepID=UPI003969C1FC
MASTKRHVFANNLFSNRKSFKVRALQAEFQDMKPSSKEKQTMPVIAEDGLVNGVNGHAEKLRIPAKYPKKVYFVTENDCSRDEDENKSLRYVGRRGLQSTQAEEDIISINGTVRGVKNRVRAGVTQFEFRPLLSTSSRNARKEEIGKIIIYTTSMSIIRGTYEKCQFVKKLFQNHRVKFEERDIYLNKHNQKDLQERLGKDAPLTVPQVVIDGEILGDLEKLEHLNESGELRGILSRFEKCVPTSQCEVCGGFRMVPCVSCNGSKKSSHRNNFTYDFQALKCISCDENGLQACPECGED